MVELKCEYSGEMCSYVPVALSIRCDECMVKKAYKRGSYEERPHGEWKLRSPYEAWFEEYKCSNCNAYGWFNWHFCPNCGADMRKEGETNE